jgi:hypothetical protein
VLPPPIETPGQLTSFRNLSHLLTSNEVPLDAEAASISQLVTDGQNRVDSLTASIDILQSMLAPLLSQRDELVESVRRHKAVLSPVRRMPPELICAICEMAPPHKRYIDGDVVDQPPWRLGQICRAWRGSALSYPSLWTSIHILVPPLTAQLPDISMIETILARSANRPLNVRFDYYVPPCFLFTPNDFLPSNLDRNRWADRKCRERPRSTSSRRGPASTLEKFEVTGLPVVYEPLSRLFLTATNLRVVSSLIPISNEHHLPSSSGGIK